MGNKLYDESAVQAIASAIRTKNGLSTLYKIAEMAPAILAIPTGGGGTNYLPTVLNDASTYSLTSDALTGVTNIRAYAFYGAKVSAIALPSGLLTIGESAFQNADLSGGAITIPASVTIRTDIFFSFPRTAPISSQERST